MKLPTVVALVDLPDAEWRSLMDTVRAAQSLRTAESGRNSLTVMQ